MIKNKEFVTRVINDCGAITKDQHISARWILFTGQQIASTYMAQRLGEGLLFKDMNIMTNINCIKMKQMKVVDCCFVEFRLCKTLMRSEERIPGLLYGRNGPAIIMVSNADNTMVFRPTNLKEYQNSKNRRYGNTNKYLYYIDDGYIWIPDTRIELINIRIITLRPKEAAALSSCSCGDDKECVSAWDYDFICPDSILDAVIKGVVQEVVTTRIQIPEDANPNMDLNQKTQTTI